MITSYFFVILGLMYPVGIIINFCQNKVPYYEATLPSMGLISL